MKQNLTDIKKALKKELDKERFEHTLGVMYTAAALAMAHGVNLHQAMLAGLLHDCAKCIPTEEKFALCKKHQITLTEMEQKNPSLIHAKLGAFLAKEKYGVRDEAVLHAILVHTTGEPGMGLLDKIIYLADYMEPNRDKASDLDEVRPLCFKDLDEALRMVLRDTLTYLKENDKEIDPLSVETYEYYKKLKEA
ncbi:MAG: bis(5'-nucleosyl)-tetraphosphatase (symmetrical) YqeK [Roseburia sp.]|nr:bis(5'-nucleosyl)-tetraphosphatase (symmetrical) YqeK [Lachnospiraceae bacterium]